MTIRACRVCGCTETAACVNDDGPCGWAERDLCTACVGSRPMSEAPRDGRMLCLLIDYDGDEGHHPLQDANRSWTVGGNNFDNTGEDRWQFAGWCWTHDHFTEGKGRVIGWAPFDPAAGSWQPISGAPKDGTEVDLWMNGQRWTGFRWVEHSWQRKEGYPAITRRLLGEPSHYLSVPGSPVIDADDVER